MPFRHAGKLATTVRYRARMEPSFIEAFKQNPLFFLIGILEQQA